MAGTKTNIEFVFEEKQKSGTEPNDAKGFANRFLVYDCEFPKALFHAKQRVLSEIDQIKKRFASLMEEIGRNGGNGFSRKRSLEFERERVGKEYRRLCDELLKMRQAENKYYSRIISKRASASMYENDINGDVPFFGNAEAFVKFFKKDCGDDPTKEGVLVDRIVY